MENTNNTDTNPMNELKNYLDKVHKPQPVEEKPKMMTEDEMQLFFKQNILPAYKKIKEQLSSYDFNSVSYESYSRMATLRISAPMSLVHFKVDINNDSRSVRISLTLKFRKAKKKKLIDLKEVEYKIISFREIETINENLILTLFTKWYTSKETIIQKYEEWKEKQEQKNK